jgi:hypothetical protein
MSASATAPAPAWLTGFDPSNPASLTGLLQSKVADPASSTVPAGFNVLAPASLAPAAPKPASKFQLALNAFTVAANTYLIQSAINGYQPLAAPAVLGSSSAYYSGVNSSAQTILAAGKSGNYGNVNALA